MRLNHFSAVIFTVATATLAACGGDDGGTMVTIPDAKVFMDAPPVVECSAPANFGMGTLGSMGTPATRQTGDWIGADPFEAITGEVFTLVTGFTGDDANTLIFQVPKPEGGAWAPGTFNFETDPQAMTVPPALSFVQANIVGNTVGRVLWPSAGSITFTQVGSTANSNIFGTVNMTSWVEIDVDTFMVVPGGCMSSITKLDFFLKQSMDAVVTRTAPAQHGARNVDAALSKDAVIGRATL